LTIDDFRRAQRQSLRLFVCGVRGSAIGNRQSKIVNLLNADG
jgi:hypothetical protein